VLGCGGVWFFGLGCFLVAAGMGGVGFLFMRYVGWAGMRMGGHMCLRFFGVAVCMVELVYWEKKVACLSVRFTVYSIF
jgi:hypothetical protein